MKLSDLKEFIDSGRELEFNYSGKRFSITYGELKGKEVISFCEFYQESTEVEDFESLLNISRYGKTVAEMLLATKDEDIDVY